jgi:hypothetical protein
MTFNIHDRIVLFESKSHEEQSAPAKQANRAFALIGGICSISTGK